MPDPSLEEKLAKDRKLLEDLWPHFERGQVSAHERDLLSALLNERIGRLQALIDEAQS